MSGPGPAVVCKGKEVHARDHPGPNDVLASFQVKPEVTITNWPCSKEKGERKHINRKDLLKACVHGVIKICCSRQRDMLQATRHFNDRYITGSWRLRKNAVGKRAADATALRRGVSRSPLPLLTHTPRLFQMPRPCAVESHARRYQSALSFPDTRCHGLAPWSLTGVNPK